MSARLRVLALVTVFVSLLGLTPAGQGAEATAAGLTRLHIALDTDSDWSSIELIGAPIRVRRATVNAGATLHEPPGRFVVQTNGQPATVTVDLVAEVPADADASPVVRVEKGRYGTTDARVEVRNGPDSVEVVHAVLDSEDDQTHVYQQSVSAEDLGAGGLEIDRLDPRPLTLAAYYPWWYDHHANSPRIRPDKPVEPFVTSDPAQVDGMVDLAADAGVDGFLVSWAGENAHHVDNVDHLMTVAKSRQGFMLAPLLELHAFRSPRLLLMQGFSAGDAARATRSFLDRVPAESQLRVGDRPVVFLFGLWDVSARDWAEYLSMVADLDPFIVGDRFAPTHPVSGLYHYDPNEDSKAELDARYRKAVDRTRLEAVVDPGAPRGLSAATVSPGYDTKTSSLLFGGKRTDRADGVRYDLTWDAALRSEPEWVVVTSWNEWYEQTHISPGTKTGVRALDQTRQWSAEFRSQVAAT